MIADEQAKPDQVHQHSTGYQKLFKNTESSFVKKYMKRKREYAHVALKLQRSVRMKAQGRVLREIFLRQRGALAFQRLFRGRRARKYVKAYFRVMTCAALIVQSVYRGHVSRRHTKALRQLMEASALAIQRVYQGYLARKYVRWVRQLENSAITVERVVRGFMARQRVKRIRLARFKVKVLIPSCIQIQRAWRGHRGRLLAKEKRQVREKLEVLHPAAVRIERVLRGYLARRLAKRFREATKAVLLIQKFWRSVRYYKRWMDLMELRRRHRMASKIGALGRGYVARKFIKREKRRRYFQFVLQPAAVNIQRIFRGYMVRKNLEDVRDHIEAAITLQQMWRKQSKIKTIQDKLRGFRAAIRNAKAAQIQRSYRCYRARQQLLYLWMSYQARYGKAAVAIQSAWRSHCSRVQLKEFRFCSLIERKARSLTQCKELREMIEFDMFDARADLKRVIKYKAKSLRRIKELKEMRLEWERRQPVVEKELSELTEEDLDRGWGEAFQTEKHILHYSLELSIEDILSRKQQVREYDAEVEDLRLELEDLERDLEECILDETMELETYREMEMKHAHTMFAEEKIRNVRYQRIRWRIKSDRKKIVLRQREDLQLIEKSSSKAASVRAWSTLV
uniref:Myosin motor domain-containing protein n=1 Tax=Globisporangium ultimum (strain ATCC 200006 / CBS 805.95 / DAOM BR144) TaxID=431595 RepID=K3WKW0_GLOUD